MAILDIPLTIDETNYTQETELDGNTFTLRYYYNGRDDYWYVDVTETSTQTAIISGKRLTLDVGLLSRHQHLLKPGGDLFLFDTTNRDVECGRNDLGERCKHTYIEESDLASIDAGA